MQRARFTFATIAVILFLAFAGVLIYNTWPRETRESLISINFSAERSKATGGEVQISLKTLENALLQSAYTARKDAQKEYDKNFSTLLTILTIFGIAWPVIVGLIQYRINDKELDEISRAKDNSRMAMEENEKLSKEVYYTIAENYYLNAVFWGNKMAHEKKAKNTNAEMHGMKCLARALIKTIYYFALSGEIGQANSKVGITIGYLNKMQKLSEEQKTFAIEGVDWDKFQSLKIQDAETIKRLADNVFCKQRNCCKSH